MATSCGFEPMQTLEIAPEGDVVLIVGSDTSQVARLRVHSLFLKTVSKVFNAMLGPYFHEGQAPSGVYPREIALPDDNASSMTILCQVFHHQYGSIEAYLPPKDVFHLAQLADKYDCIPTVTRIRTNWLNPCHIVNCTQVPDLDSLQDGLEDFGCLMAAAYILDDPRAFREITGTLALRYGRSYLQLAELECGITVPFRIMYMLEENRTQLRAKLQKILYSYPELNYGMHQNNVTSNPQKLDVGPTSMLDIPVLECFARITEIYSAAHSSHEDPGCYFDMRHQRFNRETGSGTCCYGNAYLRSASDTLIEINAVAESAGLCLDCVRSSGDTAPPECRIMHWGQLTNEW